MAGPRHQGLQGFARASGRARSSAARRRGAAVAAPPRRRRAASASASASPVPGDFSIPSAPMADLVPAGPWRLVDGGVCAPAGFAAQGMYAGLRAKGTKADLALFYATEGPAAAAGVFTKNVMCAAPVTYCKRVLAASDTARAVLINAGQANAATGAPGAADAAASAEAAAAALGCAPGEVLVESTGVIGRRIKMPALLAGVPALAAALGSSPADAHRAAVAITTTDLVSKAAALEVELPGGRVVRLGGAAKGSGMIHPNMATMLGVVTCDARVPPAAWRGMLRRAAAASFNQITVDGDTSTNDCVVGLASGAAGGPDVAEGSPAAAALEGGLTALLQGLAKAIAWDGEGATVLIECRVSGAPSDACAAAVAKSVVGSSLVKAAVFGRDPNWGRIAAAAGYSGVEYNQEDVRIAMGDALLMERGQPLEFDAAAASAYLAAAGAAHGTVVLDVRVGRGPGRGVAWGCDLSYDYVKINAEYTT